MESVQWRWLAGRRLAGRPPEEPGGIRHGHLKRVFVRPFVSEGFQPLRSMRSFAGCVNDQIGQQGLCCCADPNHPPAVRCCEEAVGDNPTPELNGRCPAHASPECRLETWTRHAKPGKAGFEAHKAAALVKAKEC